MIFPSAAAAGDAATGDDFTEEPMRRQFSNCFHGSILLVGWLTVGTALAQAQAQPPATSPTLRPAPTPADQGSSTSGSQSSGAEDVTLFDSTVGYIDSAIIANQVRLRFDSANDANRAARAEFLYAKYGAAGGPGLPFGESKIDYKEATAYIEWAIDPRLSVFVEGGERFLHPDINQAHDGMGDMNAGFKYAFLRDCGEVVTFQLRAYFPTGDADFGLGTNHYSIEPAILIYSRLTEQLGLEAELHYWASLDGTDWAGDVMRYGVGLHYDLMHDERCRVSPVVELVGWSVLSGKYGQTEPNGVIVDRSASGNTIVNLKVGYRFGVCDKSDLYVGFGHALTGDRWYESIFRVEWRLMF